MRDDGRMSSQVDYSRESVNDRLAGSMDQPLIYRSLSGEENRPRGGNVRDTTSPSAASNSSSSSGERGKDSSGQNHESVSATSSSGFFAPPSTPSPHYGFRRNTANAMAAGRRVSHRSGSAPDLGGDGRAAVQDVLTPSADGVPLPSPRSSETAVTEMNPYLSETPSIFSRDGRRGSSTGGPDSGFAVYSAIGTLPGSNGHTFNYNNLRKYGGDRIFQMTDEEVAAALLGEAHSAVADVDRHISYRYPALGSKVRSGSAPTVADAGSSSPQLLSPNLARLDPETSTAASEATAPARAPAAAGPRVRREKKGGKDEKKRRHHTSSRRSRAASSGGSRSRNSEAASQSMVLSSSAWFAGMTAAQQDRFENLQERSCAGHELARWKMLELMRYWMSAQGTRSSVEAVIRDVLVDAGLAKTKEAWVGGTGVPGQRTTTSANRPSGNEGGGPTVSRVAGTVTGTTAATAVDPPTLEPPLDKVSPKSQLIAKAVIPVASDEAAPLAEARPTSPAQLEAGEVAEGKGRKGLSRPAGEEASAAVSTLPALIESGGSNANTAITSPTPEGGSLAPANAAASPGATPPSVSPHRRQRKKGKADAATGKEEEQQQQVQTSLDLPGGRSKENGSVNRRRPAESDSELPPITATPEKQVPPALHDASGASPETAVTSVNTDASVDRVGGAKPFSESTTPQRTPSEAPLRSPRASDAAVRRSRSRSSSLKEASRRHAATYDEIPRFYFPLGRPTTREQVINGPLSKKHENPHLKVVDGVAIAAAMFDGEDSNVLSANAEVLVGGSGDDEEIPTEARRGPKVAPMSNLHVLEDRQVAHYIQREFGRLPPFPKLSSRVRLLGGRVRSAGHNSNLPYARQELLYKQQFTQCVQRVCSQCFGVPRYFAFIVLRLIQREVNSGAVDVSDDGSRPQTRHTSGNSRMTSSSSLLSQTTHCSSKNGCATLPSIFHVTPQHMKDFYDKHLRYKDSARRIFDLLILSSRLPSSAAAAASLAATNAAAGTASIGSTDEQTDALALRRLDATSLRHYLLPEDFVAYVDTLLTQHPGLAFLRQTPDFQTKYLDTVVYRIFYELDRFDRGCIHYTEFAASRLIDAFRQVDVTEDINAVLLFFSYEHFYVLYCRFWELDRDRDMLLALEDFMRYAPEDVMNPAIAQRVFAGVGRRRRCTVPERIGYEDFVWFCLSEEDKSTPQAIRYWFRVLDLDGDGILSVYELRQFYDATRNKIAQYVQEGLVTFEDVACQVFDMMRCPEYRGLYLSDLLREPEAAAVALNMLTNVVKFLQFEQRDPFVSHQERLLGGLEQSAWDRFARLEYDRMALETDEEG